MLRTNQIIVSFFLIFVLFSIYYDCDFLEKVAQKLLEMLRISAIDAASEGRDCLQAMPSREEKGGCLFVRQLWSVDVWMSVGFWRNGFPAGKAR